jgi:hypothetical protein
VISKSQDGDHRAQREPRDFGAAAMDAAELGVARHVPASLKMTQLAGYFTNILYKKIAFLFFN